MTYNNVVIFGESGVGKSSLVNMVLGKDVAQTSSSAQGCTFGSAPYKATFSEYTFTLYDTAGLNEITTVQPKEAVVNLYELMTRLHEGISLLVYVVRGPRIKETTLRNYQLFHNILCDRKVPIVLVVTGLEFEEPMSEWWGRNSKAFSQHKMSFAGQACITATRGKMGERYVLEEKYNASCDLVRELIRKGALPKPWRMDTQSWFMSVTPRFWQFLEQHFNWESSRISLLRKAIFALGGHSRKDARDLARKIVKKYEEAKRGNNAQSDTRLPQKSRSSLEHPDSHT